MKPVVQVYALALAQLKGYRRAANFYEDMQAALMREPAATSKKVRDKITRLKEKDAEEILFSPFLHKLENKKNNTREITCYFKPMSKTQAGAGAQTAQDRSERYSEILVAHALKKEPAPPPQPTPPPVNDPSSATASATATDIPDAAELVIRKSVAAKKKSASSKNVLKC
jgi:hypothetical protein